MFLLLMAKFTNFHVNRMGNFGKKQGAKRAKKIINFSARLKAKMASEKVVLIEKN